MTTRTVVNSTDPPFTWVDVVEPTRDELADIARRLWSASRCRWKTRSSPSTCPSTSGSAQPPSSSSAPWTPRRRATAPRVHEMTRKVAIFYGPDFLITIHRNEQPFLTELMEEYRARRHSGGLAERRKGFMPRLLIELINGAIATYEKPLEEAETAIDRFEATVFGDAGVCRPAAARSIWRSAGSPRCGGCSRIPSTR